jgi:hypothetical protein
MSWNQTKSSSRSPLPAQPNNMVKNEFIALDRGLLKHPSEVISWRRLTAAPGADASAIHGRLGARVALLQSPILPAAGSLYPEKELFRNLPVDKPHTRVSRVATRLDEATRTPPPCSTSSPPKARKPTPPVPPERFTWLAIHELNYLPSKAAERHGVIRMLVASSCDSRACGKSFRSW